MPSRYDSGHVSAQPLAQPLELHRSNRIPKNRIIKGPTAETMAAWDPKQRFVSGIPNEKHTQLYRRLAEGNWDMIVTGNIHVDFNFIIRPGDLCISPECPMDGERFIMFQKLAAEAKANGSLFIGQLNHCGRQILVGMGHEPISASSVQLPTAEGMVYAQPRSATKRDITRVIEQFADAATYLEKAGFDSVELHGAHGYLISQFLARDTNLRTDEYGAQTEENRLRFLNDICAAIKKRVSTRFIIGVKISTVEFQDGGITAEDSRSVCIRLDKASMDYVQLSGGNYQDFGMRWDNGSTQKQEAYFLKSAQMAMGGLVNRNIKAFLSGGLRSVGNMVKALDLVDGVVLSRPAIHEPRLAEDILMGRVPGALRPLSVLEDDAMLGVMLTHSKIRQIAAGNDPLDDSDPAVFTHWRKDMEKWLQKVQQGDDLMVFSGVVEYTGPMFPYGTRRAQELNL
ncbi:hypothetical protein B0I35DRAFT_505105 [Stachybotrys elegans]|uniref:NADH:flavin oxidoreductase/NADH oxidase N-terminal domain-containing protein n=1 Tax=Stachybotrys elegans TaxID=80388 RepID=A0A8K0SNZ4_9HYPO|nr:hypothetical protein B0I35DRAFT_505105 [Stachybotrys elegans]